MLEVLDPKMGRLCLRLWCNLHFQQSAKINMHVIQVERDDEARSRTARPLWLVWVGKGMPELSQIWRQYLRRFAIDHWYRFAKQGLHWTLPKLGTREQCERWSDLMPLLTWQLWLARELVNDRPLPWQKSVTNLTLSLSCSVDGSNFRGDWHTSSTTQNPWKVPWVAYRTTSPP